MLFTIFSRVFTGCLLSNCIFLPESRAYCSTVVASKYGILYLSYNCRLYPKHCLFNFLCCLFALVTFLIFELIATFPFINLLVFLLMH
jgi:hypothetical protein